MCFMLYNRIIAKINRIKIENTFRNKIKKCGGRVGKDTRLTIEGEFVFGKELIINSEGIDSCLGSHIVVRPGAKLVIGDNTGMSQVAINCREQIKIGSNVKIGAGVLIIDSNFHSIEWETRRDWLTDKQNTKNAPVDIEDDVFIGTRTIVNKGVKIGARSIIAAGSVVVSDIPCDCIAGGNPCKVIKSLLEDKNL